MIDFLIQLFLTFFIASFIVSYFKGKKQKGTSEAEFQDKLAEYETITADQILALSDNEVKEAITYHLLDKVDNDYKEAINTFNEEEKMIYALYQVNLACITPRMSINDFFVRAKELVKYVPIIFDELNMPEATQVFNDARALYLKYEEEYKRDIEEVVDELGQEEEEKSFIDYTNELKDILASENYTANFAKYVREHINSFVEGE